MDQPLLRCSPPADRPRREPTGLYRHWAQHPLHRMLSPLSELGVAATAACGAAVRLHCLPRSRRRLPPTPIATAPATYAHLVEMAPSLANR